MRPTFDPLTVAVLAIYSNYLLLVDITWLGVVVTGVLVFYVALCAYVAHLKQTHPRSGPDAPDQRL